MANRFVWFEWWILRKQTVPQIAELSGCSARQLYRWFNEYLENHPQWHIQRREKVNLLIDETVKTTLFYRLTDDEWEDQIREDLENLKSVGIEIESVTSDGGRNIIKAVKKACPNAVRQRYLAHILYPSCYLYFRNEDNKKKGK